MTVLLAAVAVKTPAPAFVLVITNVEFTPCVQFPVKVTTPAMLTVPVLLLVTVTPVFTATAPPIVISEDPARVCVTANVVELVPVLNVVPSMVIPPRKVVVGLAVDISNTPPELTVTRPPNVLAPPPVTVLMVPSRPVVPVSSKVAAPKDRVLFTPTVRLPPTVKAAEAVQLTAPFRTKFPAIVATAPLGVPVPLRVRLL